MDYLFEDEVIKKIMCDLVVRGWSIDSYCLGKDRGIDIVASKGLKRLLVEAKGGRGNPSQGKVVRDIFDSGQIRDHLGKAIVKILELKKENPEAVTIIAHPHTDQIFRIVSNIASELIALDILFVFVHLDGGLEFLGNKNIL